MGVAVVLVATTEVDAEADYVVQTSSEAIDRNLNLGNVET